MRKSKQFTLLPAISLFAMLSILSFLSFLIVLNLGPDDMDSFGRLRDSITMEPKSIRLPRYYMVFSTDCSKFQDWQATTFFYYASKVKQTGNVTRLVSGCTTEEMTAMMSNHMRIIAPLNPSFRIHFTPDFQVEGDQSYWNKPYGLLDWMEMELGFPEAASHFHDDIIILMDPDMILLRPLTHDFRNDRTNWTISNVTKVAHGRPIAQKYKYGDDWLQVLEGNLSHVVGSSSPIQNMSSSDARRSYPAGPPYLATGKDMYAIVKQWVKFLPRVNDIYPDFMAEMYAYSVAAAHLNLPHQLSPDLMISDVRDFDGEGFAFLQGVSRAQACKPEISQEKLPFVLHYCQKYGLGRWYFGKGRLPNNFFECDASLLREPPLNVAEVYNWNAFPNGENGEDFVGRNRLQITVLHGYMLCQLLFSLNEVAISIKNTSCGTNANLNKTWHFQDEKLFRLSLDDPTNPYRRDKLDDNPARCARNEMVASIQSRCGPTERSRSHRFWPPSATL